VAARLVDDFVCQFDFACQLVAFAPGMPEMGDDLPYKDVFAYKVHPGLWDVAGTVGRGGATGDVVGDGRTGCGAVRRGAKR
jgi:hypothetical protein